MAAVTITLTKINKVGNKVYLKFGKTEREFNDLAHLKAFVQDQLTPDVLIALFCRIAIDRQPALASPALLEGHGLSIDTSLNNWGQLI
jgi:hypothetical protein